MSGAPTVAVRGLRVATDDGREIVSGVDLDVGRGEILGLVGESGSGKTTTALALLGFARAGARISAGSVRIGEAELVGPPERAVRALRGRLVAYVPQDPAVALNPAFRIGDQVLEMLRTQGRGGARAAAGAAMERVRLPADRGFLRRFPHQLSGGQQQRVAIAIALVGEPPLVVLDEPTTGLDVVTQAAILDEIRRLRAEIGLSMVYVSHDLAVVASVADRIAVMYAGAIVEEGPARDVLAAPRHPYTRGLVASIPDPGVPRRLAGIEGVAVGVGERPDGCAFAPRCGLRVATCTEPPGPSLEDAGDARRTRCTEWRRLGPPEPRPARPTRGDAATPVVLEVAGLRAEHRSGDRVVVAADDVGFTLARGACVALVGESGSGKTTIARCIAGLHAPAAGTIALDGRPLPARATGRTREQRRRIQMVFQNPGDSLNPRLRVGAQIARPAEVLRGLGRTDAAREASRLLERVRLPTRLATRYPRELSGGERQRVAIARALAAEPDIVICDEVTSALDVSVQAAVLALLDELRSELGVALLFISHDLGVVASVADRVLVLEHGAIREDGPAARVLQAPEHPYTAALIAAAPRLAEQPVGP